MKFIEVRMTEDGLFECSQEMPITSQIVGRGMTILEAVGEWVIQTQTVVLNYDHLSSQEKQKYRLIFQAWDTRE